MLKQGYDGRTTTVRSQPGVAFQPAPICRGRGIVPAVRTLSLTALAIVLVAVGVLSSGPAPARAAAGCSGSLVFTKSVKLPGHGKSGTLDVYYDSGSGKNCAIMRHTGWAYGRKLRTDVRLYLCPKGAKKGADCSQTQTVAIDDGNFAYRAGPVRVNGRKRCVFVEGSLLYKGIFHYARTAPFAKAGLCG